MLAKCHNLPFIFALNPEKNTSRLGQSTILEELVLYIKSRDLFHIKHLLSMTKKRASRGAALPSITIVGMDELAPAKEVFKLREYVTYVNYRVDDSPPDWDDLGESDDESDDESEWVGRKKSIVLAHVPIS
jgi:hypothetical protein